MTFLERFYYPIILIVCIGPNVACIYWLSADSALGPWPNLFSIAVLLGCMLHTELRYKRTVPRLWRDYKEWKSLR